MRLLKFLKCSLILLAFFYSVSSNAQKEKTIDSLNAAIGFLHDDADRARAYINLSAKYSGLGLSEEALNSAVRATEFARKTDQLKLTKSTFHNLGGIYSTSTKTKSFFLIYKSAVDALPDDSLKVQVMLELINQQDSWITDRVNYAEQTLRLSKNLNYTQGIIDTHGFYLLYYSDNDRDLKKALYHADLILQLSRKTHQVRNEINSLIMISKIYEAEKMSRQAISGLINAMELADLHRDTVMKFIICYDVARNYNGLAMERDDGKDSVKFWKRANVYLDSSIFYSQVALRVIKDLQPASELLIDTPKELLVAMVEQGMSMYYMNKRDLETARKYMKSSASVMQASHSESIGDSVLETVAAGSMMYYYSTQNKTDSAIYYNDKMVNSGFNVNEHHLYLADLARLNFKKGDYRSAYNNLLRAEHLKDSIQRLNKSAAVKDLLIKYETAEKEKKIVELQKDNFIRGSDLVANREMNSAISILLLILALCVVFFWYYSANTRKKMQLVIEKKQVTDLLEGQESERERIAGELHDHLGSMLTTVKLYFSAVEDDIEDLKRANREYYDKANGLLDEACREVRKLAHNLGSGMLIKLGLLPALSDLKDAALKTGQVRMELMVFGMEKRLPVEIELNLFRIIQELMNNSLQHAKASVINLQLTRRENNLNVIFEDNGVGFNFNDPEHLNGTGLKNIKQRVDLLKGRIDVDSRPGHGAITVLDIPLINY